MKQGSGSLVLFPGCTSELLEEIKKKREEGERGGGGGQKEGVSHPRPIKSQYLNMELKYRHFYFF